jgi:hypothetical protein
LARDATAACTESHAHGEFAFARNRAGEEQTGDIGAGNQQDQANRGEQKPKRGASVTDIGTKRLGDKAAIGIGVGELFSEIAAHYSQLGLEIAQSGTRLKPADGGHRMSTPGAEVRRRILTYGCEQVGFISAKPEACSGDADNRVALSVQDERATENGGILRKMAPPEAVAENGDGCRPGAVLFGQESATLEKRHTENGKEIRGSLDEIDVFRVAGLTYSSSGIDKTRESRAVALTLTIQKIRVGEILFTECLSVPGFRVTVDG